MSSTLPQLMPKAKHPLQVWCFQNFVPLAEVARGLGVTNAMLCHWITGRRRILAGYADQVAQFTGGQVRLDSWAWRLDSDGVEHRSPGAGREPRLDDGPRL